MNKAEKVAMYRAKAQELRDTARALSQSEGDEPLLVAVQYDELAREDRTRSAGAVRAFTISPKGSSWRASSLLIS